MNGGDNMLLAATTAGIDTCFANPGTTELPLVRALDRESKIRPVLCLAEAVCAGAADGYGRMTGKPALTLLHLGPGLANGLAYFHNSRRAATPIVSMVGDHASWHLSVDAPLTSDIEALAKPMSVWVKTSRSADDLGADMAQAIHHSARGLATLIAPANFQVEEAAPFRGLPPSMSRRRLPSADADLIAKRLRLAGRDAMLLLGGTALTERGLRAAETIRNATNCRLLHETFPARVERGPGIPIVDRLPYLPARARAVLSDVRLIVLVGARAPVSFFGYEGQPSTFVPPTAEVVALAPAAQDEFFDTEASLDMVADVVRDDKQAHSPGRPERSAPPAVPNGSLDPESFAATIAAVQPEYCIVVDESVTSGFSYNKASAGSLRHTYLVPHVGGSIGHGLPLATGAAIAEPDRPVILLEADGSGMYTVQSLWTHAREGLDVTTIICSNRTYKILQIELGENTSGQERPASEALLAIDRPALDWVAVAEGFGVPGERVATAEDLASALRKAITEPGPHLVEAML